MMAVKKPQKGSLEGSLKRLEEIVESLEEGKISLDDAVKFYEEGILISKECVETLKATELKIRKLAKSVGGDFEIADTDNE
jgi:exodeoxyribonuclease VII small subunit